MIALIGPGCIALFVLTSALRDVYFGAAFQRFAFFAIVLVAFGLALVVFLALALAFKRHELQTAIRDWRALAMMNLTTAGAWLSYFTGLERIEPAVVNTLFAGVQPLTILILGAVGVHIVKPSPVTREEATLHGATALSLVALGIVVVSGSSGLTGASVIDQLVGLAGGAMSGVLITVSLLYAKRLQEAGASAVTMVALRFWTLVGVAGLALQTSPEPTGIGTLTDLTELALAAFFLIALPLFVFQLGVGRNPPITTGVVVALGPVLVFALQGIDGRLSFSPATFACVLAYSALAVSSTLVRANSLRLSGHVAIAQSTRASCRA